MYAIELQNPYFALRSRATDPLVSDVEMGEGAPRSAKAFRAKSSVHPVCTEDLGTIYLAQLLLVLSQKPHRQRALPSVACAFAVPETVYGSVVLTMLCPGLLAVGAVRIMLWLATCSSPVCS